MKLTTIITCDEGRPNEVKIFSHEVSVKTFLEQHYAEVWRITNAEGDQPEKWQEMRDELQAQARLADRDVAHVHTHQVDPF